MKKVLGVIPARYADSHLPGKVLKKIGDKTIVEWVYESARRCPAIDQVVVATDDERVLEEIKKIKADNIMTLETHRTGTDRLVEVADYYSSFDTIVNIQGNMPGIAPSIISGVIELKKNRPEFDVTTAARPFKSHEDPQMPNQVKVVFSKSGRALYFSRSLVPFPRNAEEQPVYLHLGVYAYSRDFLLHYSTLPPSGLERTEMLEQLRILENDYQIGLHLTNSFGMGIDTDADLALIKNHYQQHKGFYQENNG